MSEDIYERVNKHQVAMDSCTPSPQVREWWILTEDLEEGVPKETYKGQFTHVIEYAAFEQMRKELMAMIDSHKFTLAKVLVERDGLSRVLSRIDEENHRLRAALERIATTHKGECPICGNIAREALAKREE